MARPRSEIGEGRIGSIIWGLMVLGIAYAAWQLVPVYYSNYNFGDKVTELARAPRYSHTDERITQELIKAAQENHLELYVNEKTCKINTMEVRRTIVCEFDREVDILPGFKRRIHFRSDADQPLI